jgi:hypothetical protein
MQEVKAGAILVKESPLMAQRLELETEPCCGMWRLVKAQDGFAVERKIRAAAWSFFFMAAEVKVMFLGAPAAKKIQKALQGILEKLREENFNSLEITGIVAKRFLGMPYAVVSAHARHLQQGCYLESAEARRAAVRPGEASSKPPVLVLPMPQNG